MATDTMGNARRQIRVGILARRGLTLEAIAHELAVPADTVTADLDAMECDITPTTEPTVVHTIPVRPTPPGPPRDPGCDGGGRAPSAVIAATARRGARGRCQTCGRTWALRRDGTIRSHRSPSRGQTRTHRQTTRLPALIGTVLLVGASVASILASTAAAPAAHAAVCYPAVDGIVRCDDGSIQYIDQRGHYICVAPNGIITCDIPPGQPRY